MAGRYPATGRDIYGEEQVRRQILELRAEIERGDSGGPLVLEDGTVGGVVFAEARTNPDVGYALSPDEVAAAIRPVIGRPAAWPRGCASADGRRARALPGRSLPPLPPSPSPPPPP